MNTDNQSSNKFDIAQLAENALQPVQETGNVLYFGFAIKGGMTFDVIKFSGSENLSSLFNLQIDLASD